MAVTNIGVRGKTAALTTELDPDAVAAEVARLKMTDHTRPDGDPDWRLIAKRVRHETLAGTAWIAAHIPRERWRDLSPSARFGCVEGNAFMDDVEPPLEYDNWDEMLESCARYIVARRVETSCPPFELSTSSIGDRVSRS